MLHCSIELTVVYKKLVTKRNFGDLKKLKMSIFIHRNMEISLISIPKILPEFQKKILQK